MYLKKISFRSYGPLKDAEINFRFRDNGDPVPTALVGVNGSGKTLVLSTILDGIVTMRSAIYSDGSDVAQGKLFKPLKHSIRSNNTSPFTAAVLECLADETIITFSEVLSSTKSDGTFKLPEEFSAPSGFDTQRFAKSGLSKSTSEIGSDESEQIKRTVTAYYPAGRAEIPGWLGPNAKVSFNTTPRFADHAGHSIWRVNLVTEIAQWLLDIVLDCELYDKQLVNLPVGETTIAAFVPVDGRNRRILGHLNEILSEVIRNHDEKFRSARFGISERSHGSRTVQILAKTEGSEEVVIANQLQDLSTGELMAFCLFADIIRIAEMQGWDREKAEDIRGVVLADELDVHLHIRLQKEVLPKLISMFPKVQFVFSTHSPLLALGVSAGGADIISMPHATAIDASEFSEFSIAYDVFLEQNERFRSHYETFKEKLTKLERANVVTEGKTDWKHLRHALQKFREKGEFAELDVEFFETPDDMGDGELTKLFASLEKFPPAAPVICLFDRDKENVVKKFAPRDDGFIVRDLVASTCLVVPSHRKDTPSISIEHLYTDDALSTKIPGTDKRLRFKHEIGFKSDRKSAFVMDVADEPSIEIFDTDVAALANQDGTQQGDLAISKNVFADEIALTDVGADFDLEGFRPTFEVLAKILAEVSKD